MKTDSKPKYETYAQLAFAFKSGELSSDYYILLDKGGLDASLHWRKKGATDEEIDRMCDGCREIFDPPYGRQHIEELYRTIGLPVEWC